MVIALAAITAPFATVTVPLPALPIVRTPLFDHREPVPSTMTELLEEVAASPTVIDPETITLPPLLMVSVFPATSYPKLISPLLFQRAPEPLIAMLLLGSPPAPTWVGPVVNVEEADTVNVLAPDSPIFKLPEVPRVTTPPFVTSSPDPFLR